MTTAVRVEKADTGPFKIVVQVWDKGLDGAPDRLSEEYPLNHAAALTERCITSTRYLVVKELPLA